MLLPATSQKACLGNLESPSAAAAGRPAWGAHASASCLKSSNTEAQIFMLVLLRNTAQISQRTAKHASHRAQFIYIIDATEAANTLIAHHASLCPCHVLAVLDNMEWSASLNIVILPRHCRYHRQNHNERGRQSRLRRRRHHHLHGHSYGILVTIIVILCTIFSISGYSWLLVVISGY